MNLEYFKYIIEVADQGSISKAAHQLFLTQPYLSRIIKEVESEIDIVIFNRTNRGITLTSEGSKFIKKTKIIVDQYNSLQNIKAEDREFTNKFTVSTVRSSLVMESFIQLMKQYDSAEELEFMIKESDGYTPVQDIAYLDSDVGVIYTRADIKPALLEDLKRRNLMYRKVCDFAYCIILGVHHPLVQQHDKLSLSDLEEYGFVTYQKNNLPYVTSDGNLAELDAVIKVKHNGQIVYVNNRASLHNILMHTNFFSIGTQAARDQEKMFNITSIPIENANNNFQVEMGVLYRDSVSLNPVARDFIDLLIQNYGCK